MVRVHTHQILFWSYKSITRLLASNFNNCVVDLVLMDIVPENLAIAWHSKACLFESGAPVILQHSPVDFLVGLKLKLFKLIKHRLCKLLRLAQLAVVKLNFPPHFILLLHWLWKHVQHILRNQVLDHEW